MVRRGFTLLEVLLASAVLIVLLGIVWTVTFCLSRAETLRLQQSEQQRIVRNWAQILSNDFRSTIQDTEQLNKTEGDETIRHFGVDGTSTQLRIDITDYSWRTAESSELRTIFYEFHPQVGLLRRERDYAALKSVEGAMNNATEVVNGQFRYFDGGSWQDQWSSLERKCAPSAVEVTFYSLTRAEADRWRTRDVEFKEPVLNRVIIQVPSASQGIFESYQREQPPRPPQENPLPVQTQPQPPSQQPSPRPSPSHSLFGDD